MMAVMTTLFSSPIAFAQEGAYFYDDFGTDTTGDYTVTHTSTEGGIGSFTFDAGGKRARVLTGDNIGLQFSHALPSLYTGSSFSIDFLPTVKYPSGGWFKLRLRQDGNDYYELQHTDGYGPGYIRKVVSGVEVERISFLSQYSQNTNYRIIINFSPSQTTVDAFGELLVLNANTSEILVNRFEFEIERQDAYFDNINYGVETPHSNVVCETFESGYTLGAELRTHPDWFYEDVNSGPEPTAGVGVGGSVGLSDGDRIFTRVAHPFNWNASDIQGIKLQMDFKTDGSGHFDDDRIGWMISNTDDDSTNIFGVQMDPVDTTSTYNIEGYWENASGTDITPTIVNLPVLSTSTWYRLTAEFSKLTATSAKIDVALWSLDGSGNPVAVVASGSVPDTSALGTDAPNSKYFTATTMWPAYKNFTTAAAPADNACFSIIPKRFAFVVTTDWHTNEDQVNVEKNLRQIKAWIDNPPTDMLAPKFMVITGDFPDLSQTQASINKVLGRNFLWYPVIGNHEIIENINNFYSIRDRMVPSLPYIVNYGPAGSKNTSYSWEYGNAHFTVVNPYWNGGESTGSDWPTDGNVIGTLTSWIEGELTATTQTHRFAFVHEPAYPKPFGRHDGDSLNLYPLNRDAFVTALNSSGVQALFTGHTHRYYHATSATSSNYQLLGDMHQITNGYLRGYADGGPTITYVLVDGDTATYKVFYRANEGSSFSQTETWTVGDDWRYFKGTVEPPSNWNEIGFDDSDWLSGPIGIGYGDSDDATVLSDMLNGYLSIYARKTFTVADPSAVTELLFSIDFDDGFVAYLNGVEIARYNVIGTPPPYNTAATTDHEASGSGTNPIEYYDINLGLLVAGTNVLAIQGHNKSLDSSDFSLIPRLQLQETPRSTEWTAYNDLNASGTLPNGNHPNVTGHSYTVEAGALKDFDTGDDLPVTVTGTTEGGYDPQSNGGPVNANTEADDEFGGFVDFDGVHELDVNTWQNIITFNNLDPNKEYIITLTANRNEPNYVNARFTRVTIEGADTFTNASTPGVKVNSDASVSFSTGYNTVNGYVARWTGVTAADGSFSIKSEWDTTYGSGSQNTKGYAMAAFKLEQYSPPPQYTLDVTTVGSGSVAKDPDEANYDSGTVVQLTANPAAGWTFKDWSGGLSGTTSPANITMDGNKTVTATFTIVPPPVVTITATDNTAKENPLDPGIFSVSRTGSTSSALTVYYSVGGTATAGSDYTALPGSVSIPVGSSTVTITVTPIDDTLQESDETVVVTLSANVAYTVGTSGNATITITSDDQPAGEIILDNAPAGQSGGGRSFTGTWSKSGSSGYYGVDSLFSDSDGTDTYRWTPTIPAAESYDVYVRWTSHVNRSTTVPIEVTHAGGTTTKTYNQRTGGGTWVFHGNYSFNAGTGGYVQVSSVNGQACADAVRFVPAGAALPVVTITATDNTAKENPLDPGIFSVSRTGSTSSALTVYYSVGGTATAGSDYTALPGSVSIPVGSSTVTITVTPIDDTLQESDETVVVTLSANEAYTVGTPGNATITITSDDQPAGEIILDNAPAGQSGGGRSFTGTWSKSGSSGYYGVDSLFSDSDGTDTYRWTPTIPAAESYDVYVRWTSHVNRSTTVPIAVTHAGGTTTKTYNQRTGGGTWVFHGNYSFNAGTGGYVQVSSVNGQACADAVRFVPAGAALPVVTITATDNTAKENPLDPGIFSVSRTGSTSSALTVYYSVGGTATAGSDYTALPGSVSIPVGSSTVTITVTPIDDTLQESDETVVVTLSANVAYTVGTPGNATITITSDEQPAGEIILDNAPAGQSGGGRSFTGTWSKSGSSGYYGVDSLFSDSDGTDTYRWTPTIPAAESYDVYVRWTSHVNRSTTVPIAVTHAGGTTTKTYNQQTGGGAWVLHGNYSFNAGTGGYVQVSNVNGQACADAVRFVP